ncbi:hypothetical protein BGW38_010956 [Lunasporangiospora selenospora]|uniref:Pseudouridine synthase RsuA/RluA-like domain-containing protein n=1 Tax=Lunasporangiospora selenospora TaxID=979761 RepID=A0A9P6KFA9_9FUNG|nr:hypothetical protein BGW38_010956 [Lunasporangiospora selenospora]
MSLFLAHLSRETIPRLFTARSLSPRLWLSRSASTTATFDTKTHSVLDCPRLQDQDQDQDQDLSHNPLQISSHNSSMSDLHPSEAEDTPVLAGSTPVTDTDTDATMDTPVTTVASDSDQSSASSAVVTAGSKRHHAEPKQGQANYEKGERPQKKQKKQKKRIELISLEDDLNNAQYFYENGLRKILPYSFKYQTFAKGRWLGRRLIDVFNLEFRDRDNAFYERAIKEGRIAINGEIVSKDYIVQNSDIVSHNSHRHEPPVTDLPVRVVMEDNGVIVVDKPSSIPVHPSGRYRHNTVLHILMREQGYKDLFPINRLDRLTSGLMLFALTVHKAREFKTMLQKCQIKKEYVCKVKGLFPSGVIECHQPIHVACFKLTLNTVHPDGKACSTTFERLHYDADSNTSIVLAKPVTGRTHQIRVHLQWLGYPITNDPLYQSKEVWGELNGKGGVTEDMEKELIQKLLERGELDDEVDFALAEAATAELATREVSETTIDSDKDKESGDASFCDTCGLPSRADPEPEKRVMYLHAWRYKAKDWSYETDLPDWAKDAVGASPLSSSPSVQESGDEKLIPTEN